MRMIQITFLAFGFGFLVACGGGESTEKAEDAKTEEPAEDKAEEEEAEADEEEEAEEEAAAPAGVCCKFKNKKGDEVTKTLPGNDAMCKKRKGEVLDASECK